MTRKEDDEMDTRGRSRSRSRSRSPGSSRSGSYSSRSRSRSYSSRSGSYSSYTSYSSRSRSRSRSYSRSYSRSRSPVGYRQSRRRSYSRSRSRSPPRRPPPLPWLSVSPLSQAVSKAHLQEIFSHFGVVKEVILPGVSRGKEAPIPTPLHQGRAFVRMSSLDDTDDLVQGMHGGILDGQKLVIQESSLPRDIQDMLYEEERLTKGAKVYERRDTGYSNNNNDRRFDGRGGARGRGGGGKWQSQGYRGRNDRRRSFTPPPNRRYSRTDNRRR